MINKYVVKLICRILIFISCVFIYVFIPEIMTLIFTGKLYGKLMYLYIIWAIFMTGMILQLVPKRQKSLTMGYLKHHKLLYEPSDQPYTEEEKIEFVKQSNKGALTVLISWLTLTTVIGILYFSGIIYKDILLLISLFFYVCDLICVVIWCPFQYFMMKNKCCVNCRIFNWGYAMVFTPLIFIPSFFSWSLVIMSLIIVVKWEITWKKSPELFWHRTNSSLQCRNCKDKICKIKHPYFKDPLMYERCHISKSNKQ